jgi:hypothetical protein
MNADAPVLWRGTPSPWPAIKTWAAILTILIGIIAMLYWYMAVTGSCVDFILQEDCVERRRRGRMEVVFIVLAVMAAGALAVVVRTALGFPVERYSVTATEVRAQTAWPLSGRKVQPVAHVSIERRGDSLNFTGAGEKPISFSHLPKGEIDHLITLMHDLKARQAPTEPKDQTP